MDKKNVSLDLVHKQIIIDKIISKQTHCEQQIYPNLTALPFKNIINNTDAFKAGVCKFCLVVALSVENLVLQPGAELSLLRGLYSGKASAWMNLMLLGECVAISHHAGVNQTLE